MCYTEWMYNDSLCHYGTQGMKWGVRRYQYEDGRYTPEGESRRLAKLHGGSYKINSRTKSKTGKKNLTPEQRKKRNRRIALGAAAGIAAVGIGALGAHKANQIRKGRKQLVSMMNRYHQENERLKQLQKMREHALNTHNTKYYKEIGKRVDNTLKTMNTARENYERLMNKNNNEKYLNRKKDKLRSKAILSISDDNLYKLESGYKRKKKGNR